MNFAEILFIVNHIKKNVVCPYCQQNFTNKNIHVIGTTKLDGSFFLHCDYCRAPLMLTIFLPIHIEGEIQIEVQPYTDVPPVNTNDILDMHNFLTQLKNEDISKFIR